MVTIVFSIAVFAGIAAVGSFIGTSISNYFFKDNDDSNRNVNELKSEIHVMSSEVKGVNVLEVVIIALLVFVITSVIIMGLIALIVKKCRSASLAQENVNLERIARGNTSPI